MKVDVLHIAKLANLTLTKEEADKYEQQLSSILAYIDKLQTLDTKDTKETSQVTGLENIRNTQSFHNPDDISGHPDS